MVYGIISGIGSMLSTTGLAAFNAARWVGGKAFQIASLPTHIVYSTLIKPPLDKGKELVQKAWWKGVELAYTTRHAVKHTLLGAAKPVGRFIEPTFISLKRNFWDVPIASAKAAINTPIAFGKTPVEIVRGARKGISNLLSGTKSWLTGDFAIGMKMYKDSLLEPIMTTRRIISSWIAPSVELGKQAIRTKTPYIYSFPKAKNDIRHEVREVLNSPSVGHKEMEEAKPHATSWREKYKAWKDKWAAKISGETPKPAEGAGAQATGGKSEAKLPKAA